MIYLCNYRTKEVNTYGIRVAISPPPEGYVVDLYLKEAYPSKAMLNTVRSEERRVGKECRL